MLEIAPTACAYEVPCHPVGNIQSAALVSLTGESVIWYCIYIFGINSNTLQKRTIPEGLAFNAQIRIFANKFADMCTIKRFFTNAKIINTLCFLVNSR